MNCSNERAEQKTADERLTKEREREQTRREMQKAKAQHEAEMQRTSFEATQRELREASEQEATLDLRRQQHELEHTKALQAAVGASGGEIVQLLLAREQGPPARLIQIAGDARPVISVGGADDASSSAEGAGYLKGRLSFKRATSAERRRGPD